MATLLSLCGSSVESVEGERRGARERYVRGGAPRYYYKERRPCHLPLNNRRERAGARKYHSIIPRTEADV